MKFKLDENLPVELVADLRALGHNADTVADEGLRGAVDPTVLDAAFAADRILFTLDKGIANLQRYPIHRHAGVVLFRPDTSGRGAVIAFVRERLPKVLEMALTDRLTVVGHPVSGFGRRPQRIVELSPSRPASECTAGRTAFFAGQTSRTPSFVPNWISHGLWGAITTVTPFSSPRRMLVRKAASSGSQLASRFSISTLRARSKPSGPSMN